MNDRLALAMRVVDAVKRLKQNPHVDIGDLVYEVRARELEGWDGKWVTHWSEAVSDLDKALEALDALP